MIHSTSSLTSHKFNFYTFMNFVVTAYTGSGMLHFEIFFTD